MSDPLSHTHPSQFHSLLPRTSFIHTPQPASVPDPLQIATMSDEAKGTESGKVVHLVSQEGDQYEVEVAVCKMSELVKTMLPDGMGEGGKGRDACTREGYIRRIWSTEGEDMARWKGRAAPSRSSLGVRVRSRPLAPTHLPPSLPSFLSTALSTPAPSLLPSLHEQTMTAPTPRRSRCPTSRTACWPK